MDLRWLRTDCLTESINSLKEVDRCLSTVQEDIYGWKWVVLALHNSVQAFMVLALEGGNSFGVMKDELVEKWIRAYEKDDQPPKDELLPFPRLYDRIKSPKMKQYVHSMSLQYDEDTDEAMNRLHTIRIKFVHFFPCGWSLEVSGLPLICLEALSIIEFLALESGNIFLGDDDAEVFRNLVCSIDTKLTQLNRSYVYD